MDQMPFDIEVKNPWKNRESLPYPNLKKLIPIAILYVLAAMTPIFFAIEGFAIAAFCGLCAGIIYTVRRPRLVMPILLTGFIPAIMGGGFAMATLILGIIASTAAGALLFTASKQSWRMLLLPAIAWTVVYVITREAALACMTLVTVPASVLLTVATLRGERRTSAVCYTLVGLLISVVALLAIYFTQTYGAIDRSILTLHFETQRAWVVDVIMGMRDEIASMWGEAGGNPQLAEQVRTYMTRELVSDAVALIYNVLPALVVAACAILAYFSQSLLCGGYLTLGMKKVLTPMAVTFTMSVVSAVLFLVISFVTSFMSGYGLLYATLQNVAIILTPGLFLVGFASYSFRVRTSKGLSKFLYILLIVMVISVGTVMVFSILAIYGAISVLLAALGARMLKKMQANLHAEMRFDTDAASDREDEREEAQDEPENNREEANEEENNENEEENND